ncbi:MAG: GNAT family N-acetyltransferase [Rickettsiaceae bacterium]|nr:GNAT family N-acetyltransferase [Rickettsiaceae bacterium]
MPNMIGEINFTWNDATEMDWPIIRRLFVAAYKFSYITKNLTELDIAETYQSAARRMCIAAKVGEDKSEQYIKEKSLELSFLADFKSERNKLAFAEITDPYRMQYLLARTGSGYPVGFIVVQLNYKSGRVYLRWVTINPVVHRHGIGSEMLKLILKRYPECKGLELYTRIANSNAISFYTRCGFKKVDVDSAVEHSVRRPMILRWLRENKLFPPEDEGTEHLDSYRGFCFNLPRRTIS